MKNIQVLLLSVVTFCYLTSDAKALEESAYEPLMVSREADGILNKESRKAVKRLREIARSEGRVGVWITLSSTYLPAFVGQLSQEELVQQDIRARQELDEILTPLVRASIVRHPNGEPIIMGPSCFVFANVDGLKALVRDQRLAQIVGRKFSRTSKS